jgi:flagellar biosynthesis protein FlhF
MEVRTYRAATMQEALAMVRRDLGPSAAVLHTREVGTGGLLKWFPSLRRIEVTAALEVNVPSRFAAPTKHDAARAESTPAAATVAKSPAAITYEPSYAAPPPRSTPAQTMTPHQEVQTQISQLQALVEDLCRRTRGQGHHDLPESLFRIYTDLIEAEIGDDTARDLVEHLRREADGELDDPMMLRARLARIVEQQLPASGPIRLEPGRRRLVALVGPTGVGKTTTIAKLAANFRLREKKRVGLITVDTYRIAAVEQLRTYADIIDLPMHVVSTPREMRDAVNSLSSMDLVLLDTAGRSPHDDVKIQELKSFLIEAQADEVHLVLSSTIGGSSLEKTARQFGAVGTTHLLLTKLDEAAGLGHLLPLARSSGLPISYVTDGQSVPDDISTADPARLARIVLGHEAPVQMRRVTAA